MFPHFYAPLSVCLAAALMATANLGCQKSKRNDGARAAKERVEETRRDMEARVDKIQKTASDAARNANEIVSTVTEKHYDSIRSGGQPGFISLMGAPAVDTKTPDSRIQLEVSAGKSWRGKYPAPIPAHLAPQRPENSRKELDQLIEIQSWVRIGCPEEYSDPQSGGLDEERLNPVSEVMYAHTVFICDLRVWKSKRKSIIARRVKLVSLSYQDIGDLSHQLAINTDELEIIGHNRLILRGSEQPPALFGPGLSISAAQVTGQGRLEIEAIGADHSLKPGERKP
ncbi:MAG: hypothetical protein AB7G93_09270 [Bdellovibrionales bacterium]